MAASRSLTLRRLISRTTLSHLTNRFNPILAPSLLISNPSDRFKSPFNAFNPCRNLRYGPVSLVVSDEKPRFVRPVEVDEPKQKWISKKRLKELRMRKKRKRKDANKKDPRWITPKGKIIIDRLATVEDRIKCKIQNAKMKEAILVQKLKKYEVPKLQGPMPKPEELTGEERFYLKKMGQKQRNYAPIGVRGVFGGVILNMHLHWKKHETVKVICKPCKPGQVHEYAKDIARLSGGIPIQIIGRDTILFYRGKNYVQPETEAMSPIDTLSKNKALEKSKYEQSLETVRRSIAFSEKKLELYYRHVALFGDPNSRNSDLVYGDVERKPCNVETGTSTSKREDNNYDVSTDPSDVEPPNMKMTLKGKNIRYGTVIRERRKLIKDSIKVRGIDAAINSRKYLHKVSNSHNSSSARSI